MAPRRGLLVIILLLLFLTPLAFFDSTRSFAQGFPYPPTSTPTPDKQCVNNGGFCKDLSWICSAHFQTYDPGKICPANQKCCIGPEITATPPLPTDDFSDCESPNIQGDACSSTDVCAGVCPLGRSWSCQGVQTNPNKCGTCYCSDPTVTVTQCTEWNNCSYINSYLPVVPAADV